MFRQIQLLLLFLLVGGNLQIEAQQVAQTQPGDGFPQPARPISNYGAAETRDLRQVVTTSEAPYTEFATPAAYPPGNVKTDPLVRPASLTSEFLQNYADAPKTTGNWSDINPPHYDPAVGFKLFSPVDPKCTPFSLHLNGWLEMRYVGFARSKDSAIDQSGTVIPINNTNYLGFPRSQIRASGFVADPNIIYSLGFFGSTSGGLVAAPSGVVGYNFGKALKVLVGLDQVYLIREWAATHITHFGADRTMATTFIRANLGPGVFLHGKVGETYTWESSITNGFNGQVLNIADSGTNFGYAYNGYWEPLGSFGLMFSDLEYHADPAIRLGGTIGVAPNDEVTILTGNDPRNTLYRLSDGTLLGATGALGGGVTVDTADVFIASVDAGFKCRGLSFNAEYMWRQFSDLKTTGGLPSLSTLSQSGGYLFAGYFLRPKKFEIFARTSFTDGEFGQSSEVGGGFNWFLKESAKQRFVFEVLTYNNSPADNANTVYRAFASGTAIQAEYYVRF